MYMFVQALKRRKGFQLCGVMVLTYRIMFILDYYSCSLSYSRAT